MQLNSKFFLSLGFGLMAQAHAANPSLLLDQTPRQILENVRCKPQMQKQLSDWQMTGEWVKQASGGNDQVRLETPTRKFAQWIRVDVKGTEPRLALLQALSFGEVTFDQTCKPKLTVSTHPNPGIFKDRFTDQDLLAKLRDHKEKGMIYTWSPNMRWSIEGIAEIKAAAKKMNIPLTVLVSPRASKQSIDELVQSGKVKSSDTKMHSSVELVMRGISLHDPSLLVWKNGQLHRWARPGHERAARFEQWLKKESL